MHRPRAAAIFLAGTLLGALSACAPEIGDKCERSTDCSVNGDRFCDVASPGGYCTVIGCDPDTCPDDALCVEWRFEPTRSAETWCMKRCGSDGDCDRRRERSDRYECVRESELVDGEGNPLARVTDLGVRRDVNGVAVSGFCVATSDQPTPPPPPPGDAGGSPDGGAPDGGSP